jgi:hypothetical protein
MVVADRFQIGKRLIPGVDVIGVDDPTTRRLRLGAWLGLGALSRFHLVIDGPANRIFVKPRSGRRVFPLQYNRLGAYFLPSSVDPSTLVAHVAEGSPAHRAGILFGDQLISVNGEKASNLVASEGIAKFSARWRALAGTKYKLKLKRNSRELEVEVELEEIFPSVKQDDPPSKAKGPAKREPAEVK